MLKSCKYCGKIHDSKVICKDKAAVTCRKKESTEQIRFRNKNIWKKKREDIKQRDHYMCQVCLHNLLKDKRKRINGENISVHHIIPLAEDTEREYALEDDWLITLCEYHHKLADAGKIDRKVLYEVAKANGGAGVPPGVDF